MDSIIGSSSERNDWKIYFQDVDSFMFVVSLISYSQTSRRNTIAVSTHSAPFNDFQTLIRSSKTRMQEYLALFESISQYSGLRTVPIILLLNNFDPLRQRMRDYPIAEYFPEYTGSSNPSIACRYFAGKFVELDRAQRITLYVTNEVEQDDEDLEATVEEICPNLFSRALTTVDELPE